MKQQDINNCSKTAVNQIGGAKAAYGCMSAFGSPTGVGWSLNGQWTDAALITLMLCVRDSLQNRGNVDILVDGDEINLP
jgi:hypothetical protein